MFGGAELMSVVDVAETDETGGGSGVSPSTKSTSSRLSKTKDSSSSLRPSDVTDSKKLKTEKHGYNVFSRNFCTAKMVQI